MALANPQPGQPRTVEVIKTEEKGSDVNLATYLLLDGFDGDYELAVVISNDSDLLMPVAVVRHRLGLTVGILNPQRKHPSVVLQREANFSATFDKAP
jgi:NYN domain